MAGTQDPATSPGEYRRVPQSQLRVANADREHVVEHVKAAYAEGRYEKDEFEDRLERAMTARTHGDLMPIMNEIYGTTHPRWQQAPAQSAPARSSRAMRPSGVPIDGNERLGGAAAHFLAVPGFFVIGPLIMLLTGGKTSPFIRAHAVEALNFHLTLLGATILLAVTVIGVLLIPIIWVAAFVLSIVAGVGALGEDDYRYPFTIRLIK